MKCKRTHTHAYGQRFITIFNFSCFFFLFFPLPLPFESAADRDVRTAIQGRFEQHIIRQRDSAEQCSNVSLVKCGFSALLHCVYTVVTFLHSPTRCPSAFPSSLCRNTDTERPMVRERHFQPPFHSHDSDMFIFTQKGKETESSGKADGSQTEALQL